jgi:integrase
LSVRPSTIQRHRKWPNQPRAAIPNVATGFSKALGHSSITVTEKYYAHFATKQQDMLDKAAEKALAAMGD